MSLDWHFRDCDFKPGHTWAYTGNPDEPFVPWRRDIVDYEWRVVPVWWNPLTWNRARWVIVSRSTSGMQ